MDIRVCLRMRLVLVAGVLLLSRLAPAMAQSFSEFQLPTSGSGPDGVALGLDGNLWITEFNANKIARFNPSTNTFTEFQLPTNSQGQSSEPLVIIPGPDGALWFTMSQASRIGRITTGGSMNFFNTPTADSGPEGITIGSDGNIWFTEIAKNQIGRLDLSNNDTITEFPILTANSRPARITLGRDGNLWFTESQTNAPAPNKIARITTGGTVTEFVVPTANSEPWGIRGVGGSLIFSERAASKIGQFKISTLSFVTPEIPTLTPNSQPTTIQVGPDGNVYFSEFTGGMIGQINSGSLQIMEFAPPTANSVPSGITTGPDGALWFGENGANQIARFEPLNSSIPLFAAVLPSSRSVQVGGTPATVFATIINAGSTTATACAVNDITFAPAQAHFQTTNPATNALTGTQDAPVDIPAGAAQTFLLSAAPTATFPPTQIELGFSCSNANAAPVEFGLNTILASASTSPVPDVVALVATASKDGILHITGANGSNAFAVATVNVGATGSITATANTGGVTLPLTLNICETDPMSGQCITAVGPSATTTINANATPTFAIFGTANGGITFLPAVNRIFVQFTDSSGNVRGETSVAVETQ